MFHGKTIGASTPTDELLWNDKIFVGGRLFIRWEVGGPGVLPHTTTTCEEDLGGQLPRNEYNNVFFWAILFEGIPELNKKAL